jgi:microcystin-dependent protein
VQVVVQFLIIQKKEFKMEGYLGEIRLWAPNFAPRNWLYCDGQLLSIADNSALYALLGTVYGGNGSTNFGLPDFRGRVPVGAGQGPGLNFMRSGWMGGYESIRMSKEQMPEHTHTAKFEGTGGTTNQEPLTTEVTVNAQNGKGNKDNAEGNYWATGALSSDRDPKSVPNGYTSESTSLVQMAPDAVNVTVSGGGGSGITGGTVTVDSAGGGQPMENRQPFTGISYIICVNGLFPARN